MNEDLVPLAKEIANFLTGFEYREQTDPYHQTRIYREGTNDYFWFREEKGRLHFYCGQSAFYIDETGMHRFITGSELYPRVHDPEITCAMTRPAKAIADDLKRRFLPDFFTFVAACHTKAKEWEEYSRSKEQLKEKLKERYGLQIGKNSHNSYAYLTDRHLPGGLHGKVTVRSNQSLDLEVSGLSFDQLDGILTLLGHKNTK